MVNESPARPRYEIFKGKNGQFYWRLVASNGKIVAQSEGYTRKKAALDTIEIMVIIAKQCEDRILDLCK